MTEDLDRIDDEVVERSREMYRQIADGDLAFFDLIDPEIEWHVSDTMPGGGELHGLDELIPHIQAVGELWESPRAEPEEFLPAGDRLVVLGTWRARVKATGAPVEAPFAHVGEFRDGKLVRLRNYIDSGRVLQSIEGASPG